MAIDAHHLLLSPPQLFSNRELTMNNNIEPISNGFCSNGYGVVSPFSDPPPPSSLLHMYGGDTIPTTTDYFPDHINSDFFPLPTRKRTRGDSSSHYYHNLLLLQNARSSSSSSCVPSTTTTTPFSFLGQDIDISSHINQQHHEIDQFVSLHMERVKYEIEEKRKKQARSLMEAIEHGLAKRLKVKEEERDRIGKINHALEERVKSLSIENQIWRDLAQTNEATANNLRNNLEQVLAQVNETGATGGVGLENEEEDAQSCCGSSEETVWRKLEKEAQDKRMCRNCGEEESCVLILPCRHLCLCGICGSSMHTCPICRSPKNASVHVNMSS